MRPQLLELLRAYTAALAEAGATTVLLWAGAAALRQLVPRHPPIVEGLFPTEASP